MSNTLPPQTALELAEDRHIPKRQVISWALWDWGSAAFNAVITTFVFTVYLTSELFLDPAIIAAKESDPQQYDAALAGLSSGLGLGLAAAGIIVALLAPVLGQRSDSAGRRKLWLGINTGFVILATALMWFVEATPSHFVFGVILVAAGNVFFEIGSVNYNAMLVQVSTPKTVGKVSGFGWGAGYLGGIVLLLVVYIGFIAGEPPHWFGVGDDAGANIRMVAVFAAAWTLLFSLPIFLFVPELETPRAREKVNFFASYRILFQTVKGLYANSRNTFYFLLASAVYRDGLAGIFTFGGIIAAVTFGFSAGEVLIFGIVANVVAGVGTFIAGWFDDRFGAKPVIVTSLVGLIVAGLAVFFAHDGGPTAFWIGGLVLCLFVGPAQAASRSFLARIMPAGREGEIFGLYTTTGRAVSFLAQILFAAFITWFGAQYWGILGLIVVLFVGLMLLLPVKSQLRRPVLN